MKSGKASRQSRRKGLYLAAIFVAGTALAGLLVFQYFKVSEQIQFRLKKELAQRGIALGIEKLYLDPFGRVVARDVRVDVRQNEKTTQVTVNQIRFGLNWISWWRGKPFLDEASVEGADVRLPLTEDTFVRLDSIYAEIGFRADQLLVRMAEAKIGELVFKLKGTVGLQEKIELKPAKDRTPESESLKKQAEIWQNIYRELERLSSPIVFQVEFDLPSLDWTKGVVRVHTEGRNIWWKGALIQRFILKGQYEDDLAKLEMLQLKLARGKAEASGVVQLREKKGRLSYRSDVDFTLLGNALPKPVRRWIGNIAFSKLPVHEGIVECDWSEKFAFFARLRVDWENFIAGGVPFNHVRALASYDGLQFLVSNLEVQNNTGTLTLDLLKNQKDELQGKLSSTIDPTTFRGLFPQQALLRNIKFAKVPPKIEAEIAGVLKAPKLNGSAEMQAFTYTNGNGTDTTLAKLKSSFEFEGMKLRLPDLNIVRVEGETASGVVVYDFGEKSVSLENAKLHVDVPKFAPLFGPKLESYVKPYRFHAPPDLTVNGMVDLAGGEKTDFHLRIQSSEGMDYDFLGKTLSFDQVEAEVNLVSKELNVAFEPATRLYGGVVQGTVVLNLREPGTPYQTQLSLEKVDFQKILQTYFAKEDVKGDCNATFDLIGKLNDKASIGGTGTIAIEDGDVYQIPVFGPLSEILGELLPVIGYSKARQGRAEFAFDDGKILIEKLDILSTAFAVIGYGTYDYMEDDVDLSVRVNVRGIFGIPFFPVSKLFEYQGRGSLRNPTWEPKIFE